MGPPKGRKKFTPRHGHLTASMQLARPTELTANRARLTLETQVRAHLCEKKTRICFDTKYENWTTF